MMQLLFQILYEKAKTTPKEVIFIIDEAQFMLKDGASLDFLSQRVRHSRHFDMSIRFATQNVKDFLRTDKATDIINNSYLTIYHRTNEIRDFRDQLDLSEAQARFIEQARSGKDFEHSQALYEINNEYYPVKVTATEAEADVIDYAPTDPKSDLPGYSEDEDSAVVEKIAEEVQSHAEKTHYDAMITEPPLSGEEFEEARESLSDNEEAAIEFIGWENQAEALERIDDGENPGVVLAEYVEQKADQMARTLGREQLRDMLFDTPAPRTKTRPNSAVTDGGEGTGTDVWEDTGSDSDESPSDDDDSDGGWP
jgi:hypothetical protein